MPFNSQDDRIHELESLLKVISRGKYQWESTFDAITMPVQIVTRDYTIDRANVGFAAVGNHDIRKVVGKKCYQVFADRTSPCEGCPLTKALDVRQTVTLPLKQSVYDRQFEVTAYPYGGDEEGHAVAIMSYRDVTEERRLQEEIVQQEKMAAIGTLAGGVAHEINNPLGGILAFTQLMLRNAKGNETLTADLKEIEAAALRCRKIVAELLEFSHAPKRRENGEVRLKALIEKVFPFLKSEIKSHGIEFNLEGDDVSVFGQADRLQQVFLNLMTNACHAMPKGGKLTIKLRKPENGGAEAIIADTGEGIQPEVLPSIFNPFFTTKEPGKGTGLGLSICYRIVKEHGGTIDVKSELHHGTTFSLRFPKAETLQGRKYGKHSRR